LLTAFHWQGTENEQKHKQMITNDHKCYKDKQGRGTVGTQGVRDGAGDTFQTDLRRQLWLGDEIRGPRKVKEPVMWVSGEEDS
jgi:hypothetical protein